ncbi:MAG: hypothetical protein ACK5Z5_09775 [Neisseriaceae bacterium]
MEDILKQLSSISNPSNASNTIKLNEKELDYLYNLGVRYFKLNNFSQALPLFQITVAYDSSNIVYLKALAGCLQALKEFLSAHFIYKIAYIIDNKNDECLFYSGVCLYELGQLDNATQEFDAFLSITTNKELSKKANLYLEIINKNTENTDNND